MRKFLRSPLGIALLVALAVGVTNFGEPVAHVYWNTVYKIWHRPAPQFIVVVNADDPANLGASDQAHLIDLVRASNPRRLYIDMKLQMGLAKADDARMQHTLARLGENSFFVIRPVDNNFHEKKISIPSTSLTYHHPIVADVWNESFVRFVESAPYEVKISGKTYPTFSSSLSSVHSGLQSQFYPDFSVDPATIPIVSARALLNGTASASFLSGKMVIVSDAAQGAVSGYFGHGIVNPIAFDIAGAVALQRPANANLSGMAMTAIVFALIFIAGRSALTRAKVLLYTFTVLVVVLSPIVLRRLGLVASPDVALVCIGVFGAIRLWQKRTRHIQHTGISGLPNMHALSASDLPVGCDVVVATIARFEEMLATLPRDLHAECALQIARRITAGCGSRDIFHSDGGHFAWIEEARPLDIQLDHLEGLRALFSAPLQVGSHTFDTNIHFGLERNEGVASSTRVNSALASANEALANGRAIELFEAHRLAEAPWELSLHARIDEGLRNGDIWLAYQAQWDIATNRIVGAEALIRWNHPTRGPIAPNAFILQAERAGRIDALTYWVLEHAITATLAMNAKGPRFQMSVNLSGQMVDKPDLVGNFAEIVSRRGVDPRLITVEVTETSSMGNREAGVHNLTRLRQLGFRLSIDDFGTGEASLAYLADLPSDELKLDRRFVARIVESGRERAIVASTIVLAHALGQTVVAEGIEDAATLALLRDMGCDLAQGFYLGRPAPFVSFERDFDAMGTCEAARV